MPVCAADWCMVTTVEGIGSARGQLHPIQERLTAMHGSQCGFCTPGIVVVLYALFRSTPSMARETTKSATWFGDASVLSEAVLPRSVVAW